MATPLEVIASELLKSAIDAEKLFGKTKDQSYKDKAVRLRRIVANLQELTIGTSSVATLNDLTDVTISAPANGQVLTYNSTTGQWENQTAGGGGGGGDMLKSTYDVDNTGVVDNAEAISIIGRNATGATLYRGTIVYISGSTGNRPNFAKAQANAEATSAGTFGVVRDDIANNADGFVTTLGYLDNLDTRTVATHPFTDVTLADGDTVYLHPTIAGYITNVKPSAPNHIVYVGKVTRTSPTNGTIVYRIQNGYELDEIHDVAISSKANNDLLTYESASGLWKNKTFSAIFGGTPLVSVPTLDQVTTAGNTTTNAITVGGLTISNGSASITKTTSGATLTLTPNASDNAIVINNNGFIKFTSSSDSFIRGSSTTFGILDASYASKVQFHWGGSASFINTGGNLLIGTTTDAGYKLDVNGTARVQGNLAATGNYIQFGTNVNVGIGSTSTGATFVNNGLALSYATANINNAINLYGHNFYSGNYNATSGTQGVISLTGPPTFTPTSGTAVFNALNLAFTINQTGGANGITRGLYVNPTITAAADFRAIETTAGKVIIAGSVTAASAIAQGVYFNNTLVAAANNDVLVGLDINPTFTNGAYTGVSNYALRVNSGQVLFNAYGAYNTGTPTLRIENVDTNNVAIQVKGNIANYKYYWIYDSTTSEGIYKTDQGRIDLYGGTSVGFGFVNNYGRLFTIGGTTGNVLINTITDSGYKLDVNGTGRFSSSITGTVLKIDGTGAATGFEINSQLDNDLRPSYMVFSRGGTAKYIIGHSYGRSGFFISNGNDTVTYLNINSTGNVLVGTTTDSNAKFVVAGSITAASLIARGVYFNNTLVAAANNDVLVGLDINPTFTNGAFTGVDNWDLRTKGKVLVSSTTTGNVFPLVVRSTNYPGILLQSGSTGTNHSAAPYDGFAFWINYDVSHAKGLITNYENNGISIYNGTNPAVGLTIFGSTNNVAINTTTDAGYKLDVVGADSRFNGVRVGIGAGGVSTNTVVGLTALGNNTSGAGITAIGYQAAFNNTTGAITAIGHRAGYSNTTGINNTVLGGDAFYFNTTGSANVAVGFGSLQQNVTGSNNTAVGGGGVLYYNTASNNTAVGYQAAFSNTSGGVNTAIGYTALYSNTTGAANTALGYESLTTNSTGSNNTAIGRVSSKLNTTGSNNTSLGAFSLFANTTASDNVAIGNAASQNNVVGNNNTSVGSSALYSNTASNNTAVGYQAGFSNTSGGIVALGIQTLYSNTTGNENTAVGRVALYFNTTGNSNTSIGAIALYTNTTGSNNTANGQGALHKNTIGGNNTSVGSQSLFENTTGINNVAIGYNAGNGGVPNTTGANNIFIGYQATGVSATESNRTWIGNSSTTSTWLAGNVLIGTTTNAGYKLDVNGTFRAQGDLTAASITSSGSNNSIWAYDRDVSSRPNDSFRITRLYGYTAFADRTYVGGFEDFEFLNFTHSTSGSSTLYLKSISDIQLHTNNTSVLNITSSGRVGIGTATPSYPFHIASSAAANVFGTVQSTNANGTAAWVAFNDQSDNVVYRVFGSGASGTQLGVALSRSASLMANLGGSGKFLIGTYSGSDVAFGAGDQERMRIVNSTGNVLVGTVTDLGNKLEVSGTLNATAYKINNVPGYTGILTIVTNPPGMQNIDIQSGIIVNIF